MRHPRVWSLLVVTAIACADTAAAQVGQQPASSRNPEPIGITLGYPASFGVMWHVTERLAIRPELSFSFATSESQATGVSVTSSDTWSLGIGVSALFDLRQWDGLRTYVAPRFTYSRGEATVDSSSFGGLTSELRSSGFAIAGLFGASYRMHPRFAVFGEAGLSFGDAETRSSAGFGARSNTQRLGTTAGVGVIFYLQ